MKQDDFDLFAGLIKQRSGLVLSHDKAYLLESRLPRVARKFNVKTLEELAQEIRAKRDEAMMRGVAEAMTTNETIFFRDQKPFDQFRNLLLPQFLQARAVKRQIRIWSAATASGQEAYSLAMICADEATKLHGWKVDIIGTDLSDEMIERAKSGTYNHFEVQRGLPIAMLVKYFQQSSEKWQIKDHLRHAAQFRVTNLLMDFGPVGTFDAIFCRNVLSYFDQPTKTRVLNALAAVLAPDGALFLGASETVLGLTDKLKLKEGETGLYVLANPNPALDIRHASGGR